MPLDLSSLLVLYFACDSAITFTMAAFAAFVFNVFGDDEKTHALLRSAFFLGVAFDTTVYVEMFAGV